ncbi:hypothetical protein KIPB_002833 [Kipferlia bialata]|uniref:Uncharacterized protein n=1 Tax=Kipferlia bialata TaxID=797122 RepID=A0A9K3CRK2_9EUKA|nr:hypothetical protein KIPB_002833 [Kipferlia bialata]|eukprot:g2833.t1
MMSRGLFRVDPAKGYRVVGRMRSAGTCLSMCYLGVVSCDSERRLISCSDVKCISPITTLSRPACGTDTRIYIADGSQWVLPTPNTHVSVAFGARSDLSDLPNRLRTPTGDPDKDPWDPTTTFVRGVERVKEGEWCVSLASHLSPTPLTPTQTLGVGTGVRLMRAGGTWHYSSASAVRVPSTPTTYPTNPRGGVMRGVFSYTHPERPDGVLHSNQMWYPGAVYGKGRIHCTTPVRPHLYHIPFTLIYKNSLIIANYRQGGEDVALELDYVTVQEVELGEA